jgi:hypothetical protein
MSAGFNEKGRTVPLPAPQRLFDALVWQRGHREPGVCDAEAAFLLGQHRCGRLHGVTLHLGRCHGTGAFNAMRENQLMNSTHGLRLTTDSSTKASGTLLTQAIRRVFVLSY